MVSEVITVRPLDQKRLLAVAGRHAIVTDRKPEHGGTDIGCTSGELLLVAIGSCATGSVRNFLESAGAPTHSLYVRVAFEAHPEPEERDMIKITINLLDQILDDHSEAIVKAALSGAVVSRLRLGSQVNVETRPLITDTKIR